jgi:hypothetical protein
MNQMTGNYTLKNFLPLITIFAIIILFTVTKQMIAVTWTAQDAMQDFMGAFFVVFGCFKLFNLNAFAESYAIYDLIAKRVTWYAFAYPFIEVTLGALYVLRLYPTFTNWITLVISVISALGVAQALSNNELITCACLGMVFKMPMTYVTLFEDLLMAGMAIFMLVM